MVSRFPLEQLKLFGVLEKNEETALNTLIKDAEEEQGVLNIVWEQESFIWPDGCEELFETLIIRRAVQKLKNKKLNIFHQKSLVYMAESKLPMMRQTLPQIDKELWQWWRKGPAKEILEVNRVDDKDYVILNYMRLLEQRWTDLKKRLANFPKSDLAKKTIAEINRGLEILERIN